PASPTVVLFRRSACSFGSPFRWTRPASVISVLVSSSVWSLPSFFSRARPASVTDDRPRFSVCSCVNAASTSRSSSATLQATRLTPTTGLPGTLSSVSTVPCSLRTRAIAFSTSAFCPSAQAGIADSETNSSAASPACWAMDCSPSGSGRGAIPPPVATALALGVPHPPADRPGHPQIVNREEERCQRQPRRPVVIGGFGRRSRQHPKDADEQPGPRGAEQVGPAVDPAFLAGIEVARRHERQQREQEDHQQGKPTGQRLQDVEVE